MTYAQAQTVQPDLEIARQKSPDTFSECGKDQTILKKYLNAFVVLKSQRGIYMHQFGFENMGLQKVIANLNFIRLDQEGVFLNDTLVFHAISQLRNIQNIWFQIVFKDLKP